MCYVVASLKYRTCTVVFFLAGQTFGGFGPTRLINFGRCNFSESITFIKNLMSVHISELRR